MNTTAAPKHAGSLRRRLGVVLFGAGVLWGVLIVVSMRWWFGYAGTSFLVDLGDGTLYIASKDASPGPPDSYELLYGWCGGRNTSYSPGGSTDWTWTWWAWGDRENKWSESRRYSAWPLAPILSGIGAAMFWPGLTAARRRRRNRCAACGYSREGLTPDSPCPECGALATR